MLLGSGWRRAALPDPGLGTLMSCHSVPFLRIFFPFPLPPFPPTLLPSPFPIPPPLPLSLHDKEALTAQARHSPHDTSLAVEPSLPFIPMNLEQSCPHVAMFEH